MHPHELPHPSPPRSSGPADRARVALLDHWAEPDWVVAKLAESSPAIVQRARAELQAAGHIPACDPELSADAYRRDASDRARAQLLADPARSNMVIATAADCHRETVQHARRELEAAGAIPVLDRWERRGRPGWGKGSHHRPRAAALPASPAEPELPPMPASMRSGLCASGQHDPALWHPGQGQGGQNAASQAIAVCLRCPALDDCRAWSMCLPGKDRSIYGGMLAQERIRRQHAQRPAAP